MPTQSKAKGMSSKELDLLVQKNPGLAERMQITGPNEKKKRKTATSGILAILGKPPKSLSSEMNVTEKHLDRELQLEKLQGHIKEYHFESIGLKIAPKTWYFPDFVVFMPDDRMHVIEVKGFLRDDAAAKYKVAVGLYPGIHFHMIRRENHSWQEMYQSLLTLPEKTDGKNCRITRE